MPTSSINLDASVNASNKNSTIKKPKNKKNQKIYKKDPKALQTTDNKFCNKKSLLHFNETKDESYKEYLNNFFIKMQCHFKNLENKQETDFEQNLSKKFSKTPEIISRSKSHDKHQRNRLLVPQNQSYLNVLKTSHSTNKILNPYINLLEKMNQEKSTKNLATKEKPEISDKVLITPKPNLNPKKSAKIINKVAISKKSIDSIVSQKNICSNKTITRRFEKKPEVCKASKENNVKSGTINRISKQPKTKSELF